MPERSFVSFPAAHPHDEHTFIAARTTAAPAFFAAWLYERA